MKTFNSVMMVVVSLVFVVSLCSLVYAENWQLVKEIHREAMPEADIDAETEKIYVDVDSIEKDGSIRGYWLKSVIYDFGLEETFTIKTYNLFDCASNRGAIKIYDNGDVVPDHKLVWIPVCTGNEPSRVGDLGSLFKIDCLPFEEHEFVCGQ